MDTPVYPVHNYLSNGHGLKSWLLTKDHKRIAVLYLISISLFFFLGSLFAVGIRLELTTPQGDLFQPDTYNKFFTLHGVIMVFFFLIPSVPAVLGNFLIPPMIGAKDLAFPRINLLSWYIYVVGGIFTLFAIVRRRRRHRLDVLYAVQRDVVEHQRGPDRPGRLHLRLLVDPDRAQLHRDDSPDARAGPHLVQAAAVRVGALRHQPDPGAGHAGHRHHHRDAVRRAGLRLRHLRPGPRRRSGALPAPVLVLLAPGGLHHDPAGARGDQRAGLHLLAQAHLRLQLRGLLVAGDRRLRLHRLGASHVRGRHLDLRRDGLLVPELLGGHSLRHQGVQLDGDAAPGIDSRSRRRSSSSTAFSGCS